jgi:hypothetical protein
MKWIKFAYPVPSPASSWSAQALECDGHRTVTTLVTTQSIVPMAHIGKLIGRIANHLAWYGHFRKCLHKHLQALRDKQIATLNLFSRQREMVICYVH